MNLRTKLLLGIGVALVVTFTLVALMSYVSMEQSYRVLESQEVRRAVDSSVKSLDNDMENSYSIATDFAVWSETYDFALGRTPAWIEQNSADIDLFRRFNVDYLLLFNSTGRFIYGRQYNLTSQTSSPVLSPVSIDTLNLNISGNASSVSGVYGLISNPEGTFFVTTHPILADNFIGPSAGNLLLVTRIDRRYLADLSARSGSTITIIPAGEIENDPSLAGVMAGLTPANPVAVIPEDGDTVSGYTRMAGLQEPGGFYLRVSEPRTLYQSGLRTIATFLTFLLGAGIFIIVFVLLVIDRIVLSRINHVISTVREKTESGNDDHEEGEKSGDELARLALEIDPVFMRLAESRNELRESEERYSALFSNNYSVSLIIDPDTGRILDVNDAAARYYGYSRGQFLAMGIYDLNRLPRDKVVRDLLKAKDEKEKHFFSTHYRADGEKRYVEVYSGPIRIRGKPLFYSIIHDITDSRLAGKALRESEERYRTLIDRLPDYVIVHRDGILLYVNPAAAARMGYDSGSLIGRPILSFIAPEYHDTVRQAVVRRMAGEDIPSYEMKIQAKDGTLRAVLTNGASITYEGRPASLNVLTDITDRKVMEEEVRSLNRVLEERVKERTETLSKTNEQLTAEIAAHARAEEEISRSLAEKVLLLREIHHRVKNNLQIIASLLKLQSRVITDPRMLEAIMDTQSRVRAMSLVHERIYRSPDIAEINLGEYLNFLVRQVFQFYNVQQHLISISVSMPEIMADIDTVTPLGLILNELVSNSLKYAFPDGRKGSITIDGVSQEGDRLRFRYHDSGVGLPAGFDWKASESLGLRLVNSLVDQLEGTIEMEPGEGTTFIITIRRSRAGRTGS